MILQQGITSAGRRFSHVARRRKAAVERAGLAAARDLGRGAFEPLEQRVLLAVDPVIKYNFDEAAGTLVLDTAPDGVAQNGTLAGTPPPVRTAPGQPDRPGGAPTTNHLDLDGNNVN